MLIFGTFLLIASVSCQELPKLCIKNATNYFDVFSKNCWASNNNSVWKEKEMLIMYNSQYLVNGFGFKCLKEHKIVQTTNDPDITLKMISDYTFKEAISKE